MNKEESLMALAEAYAFGIYAIEFPDCRKEREAAIRSAIREVLAELANAHGVAQACEARAEKAEAEVERLKAGGCARNQGLTQYCAEAEALRKDAERYRWLRDGGADNSPIGVYEWSGQESHQRRIWLARDELDAAIDDAIKDQP